jgi:hypothetical protein
MKGLKKKKEDMYSVLFPMMSLEFKFTSSFHTLYGPWVDSVGRTDGA